MDAEKISNVSHGLFESLKEGTALQSLLFEENISQEHLEYATESKVLNDFFKEDLGSDKETLIKKVFASAIVLAKQNDCLPFDLPSSDPTEIAKLVDAGLSRAKIAYQVGCGRLDPVEAVDALIDNQVAQTTALVDMAFKSGAANKILTQGVVAVMIYCKVPNAQAFAPIISKCIQRVEVPINKFVNKGIKVIAQSAKTAVRKAYSGVKATIKSFVKTLA